MSTPKVLSKAEALAAEVSAFPTRDLNQWTEDGQLIADIIDSTMDDQVIKTANYTVVINQGDIGKTLVSALDGMVFTLPSIAIGNTYKFINTAADGAAKMSISPAAADGISWAGSATDDKDLINTKATALKGDYVTIASLDQVIAWQVVAARGDMGERIDEGKTRR